VSATTDTTTPDPIPGYSGPVAEIIPGALYVAERPGGGGRSHRVARRERDLAAAAAAGVGLIVSLLRSRHALIEYAQAGYGVRWYPLKDLVQARAEVPRAAREIAGESNRTPGAILVHADRWGEWDTAIAAALLLSLGLVPAGDTTAALDRCGSLGLPVGDLAREILAA
jgi:hypothetical protein